MQKAVILLSGGLDSTTCLAYAQSQGFSCYALSFSYNQRHSIELDAAKKIAQHFKIQEHHIIDLDIRLFQNSALTDENVSVPDFSVNTSIPVTYVPARNTLFLSMALAFAESINAQDLYIGASSIDYSNYPDCRPEYIAAFETLANLGTKAGVEGKPFTIHAPLQHLTKSQTIQLGTQLGVDYSLTISCYQANSKGEACGRCDSCEFRKQGFKQAAIQDPTRYLSH